MIVAPSLLKNDEVLNSHCHELKEERLSSQQGKALLHATERPLQIEETPSSNQRRATLYINDVPPVGTDALVCPHKGA